MRVGFYAFTAPLNFPRTYPFPWPDHMQREGCARYARGGATNHAETQLPPSSNDACRNCSFQSPLCVTCPVKLSTIVVVRYAAFARIGFPFCKTVAILNVSTGAKIHGMSCIQANRFLENEMGVSLKGLSCISPFSFFPSHYQSPFIRINTTIPSSS